MKGPILVFCDVCGSGLRSGDECAELVSQDGAERMKLCRTCWDTELELRRIERRKRGEDE